MKRPALEVCRGLLFHYFLVLHIFLFPILICNTRVVTQILKSALCRLPKQCFPSLKAGPNLYFFYKNTPAAQFIQSQLNPYRHLRPDCSLHQLGNSSQFERKKKSSTLGIFKTVTFLISRPGISVGIATELRAGRSAIESRWGRDFPPVQTGPEANPANCKMGTGSFPGSKVRPGRAADHSPPSSAAVMEE